MNFNYSYRAFLITSLLFGFLFTILFGVKVKSKLLAEEENHAIEFDGEIIEEEDLAQFNSEDLKVETNRAFNEAEAFIRELEEERDVQNEETQSSDFINEIAIEKQQVIKQKESQVSEKEVSEEEQISEIPEATTTSKTTIRYNLAERTALELPNPVYTCESGGKVVITIEVNDFGKVIKTTYNKKASTTENGCLIDSAIDYAKASKFTSKKGRKKQLGSISYNFPGQQH